VFCEDQEGRNRQKNMGIIRGGGLSAKGGGTFLPEDGRVLGKGVPHWMGN